MKTNIKMANSLQAAYDHLNQALFVGQLPDCLITLTRNKRVLGGFFAADQWSDEQEKLVHEIGINANYLVDNDPTAFYNVLLHEMVHLYQHATDTAGRKGYHNQAFADMCFALQLEITVHDKNAAPGQLTGQNVSTELIQQGRAARAVANIPVDLAYYALHCLDMDDSGNVIIVQGQEKKPPKKAGKRAKYTCPMCASSVWGKQGLSLMCMDCNRLFIEAV